MKPDWQMEAHRQSIFGIDTSQAWNIIVITGLQEFALIFDL
jgi:hypothetical protein